LPYLDLLIIFTTN